MSPPVQRVTVTPIHSAERRRARPNAAPASPELCPRCRGSFVVSQVRDGRLSVECPLCGRLWAWARSRFATPRPNA